MKYLEEIKVEKLNYFQTYQCIRKILNYDETKLQKRDPEAERITVKELNWPLIGTLTGFSQGVYFFESSKREVRLRTCADLNEKMDILMTYASLWERQQVRQYEDNFSAEYTIEFLGAIPTKDRTKPKKFIVSVKLRLFLNGILADSVDSLNLIERVRTLHKT